MSGFTEVMCIFVMLPTWWSQITFVALTWAITLAECIRCTLLVVCLAVVNLAVRRGLVG